MTPDQKLFLYLAFITACAVWGLYFRAREVQRKRLRPDLADYVGGLAWGAFGGILVVGIAGIVLSVFRHISS